MSRHLTHTLTRSPMNIVGVRRRSALPMVAAVVFAAALFTVASTPGPVGADDSDGAEVSEPVVEAQTVFTIEPGLGGCVSVDQPLGPEPRAPGCADALPSPEPASPGPPVLEDLPAARAPARDTSSAAPITPAAPVPPAVPAAALESVPTFVG